MKETQDTVFEAIASSVSKARNNNPFEKIGDIIYEALEGAILSSTLEPGSRLSVTKLSETLGVSTTPVRDAINLLVNNGFVSAEQKDNGRYNSYFVFDISATDMRSLFDVRSIIEGWCAAVCARKNWKLPIQEFKQLAHSFQERLIASTEEEKGSKSNMQEIIRLDRAFHTLIVDTAANEYLRQMYKKISRLLIYLSIRTCTYFGYEQDPDNILLMGAQHVAICRAICDGYPETAESLMREHIELCCSGAIWNKNLSKY